ncbi:MAG TPA: cytochrome c3 family protein [Candidatus Bathyarchaeia archaeon]|nr:cytochrome c3 family protein [Candidatus Bathyarchaeia archaeon]
MKLQIRSVCLAAVVLSLLTTLASLAQSSATKSSAAASSAANKPKQHPVELAANTPASTCLECHGNLQQGKFVHTAMAMGCTTCHAIATKNGRTSVSLVSDANQLCESCHPLSTEKDLHGPYREGLCVTCHSPHSSDFPDHTWASAQDTCLGCHTRARLKEKPQAQTVTTPWGQTLTMAEMKGWMYLNLNKTLTANHPVEGHPVTGPNRKPGTPPVSCLSCHKSHASNFTKLLTAGPPGDMPLCKTCGVCEQCHERMF